MAVRLSIDRDLRARVWNELLLQNPDVETAGFLYAAVHETGASVDFEARDWLLIPQDGYSLRTDRYLELTDAVRGDVIKRAHDNGHALVEFHSHLDEVPPAFSHSDRSGFTEFVPYVRWRLKGRPYVAVVVSKAGFDGLAWLGSSECPTRLDGIVADGEFIESTGLSLRTLEDCLV
ncbi:MAG: hypothetical protein F4066_11165 [Chloroflexi bacterium]|nr:hypothetical protein [Chloroflexota bacterium]MYI05399.1 hypothetical protein [Chloroflexota bacterium]